MCVHTYVRILTKVCSLEGHKGSHNMFIVYTYICIKAYTL